MMINRGYREKMIFSANVMTKKGLKKSMRAYLRPKPNK
jgi:hypothetical protein